MKKAKLFLILTVSIFLTSCPSNSISDEMLDELNNYSTKVRKVHVYNIDKNRLFLSVHDWFMYTEEYIRQNGDLFIFYNSLHSEQAAFITFILFNAKQVNIDPEKNIVQTKKVHGEEWTKDGGCVIDIYDVNEHIVKTYIMQNGLDVFYEKGKEGTYYEMPKKLFNNFYIRGEEFVSLYLKGRNRK